MNLLRILIKACIFMIFIIPKLNVVVQHSTLVNRLPSSTSILTSTVFSIPCWSPASHQHAMLVTSIPCWSPASHQHSMLVTSIPPAFHAGQQHTSTKTQHMLVLLVTSYAGLCWFFQQGVHANWYQISRCVLNETSWTWLCDILNIEYVYVIHFIKLLIF